MASKNNKVKKILMLDDEESIRYFYRKVLEEEGYSICEASTSAQAFKILDEENISLILLDIKLKGESGLDFLIKIFKTREKEKKIPVIILSSFQSFQDDAKAWIADDYIVKSSDTKPLIQSIKKTIERFERERERERR